MKKTLLLFLLCFVLLIASCAKENGEAVNTDTGTDTDTVADETTQKAEDTDDGYINAVFSLAGGIYDSAQTLELSLPENAPSQAYIVYTNNGDEPTANGTEYSAPIDVLTNGASCIRAVCFDANGEALGRIKTNTYIKKSQTTALVVSLATDKSNLYGEDGIITNCTKTGKAWERPCHIEIFDDSGELISQDAGIRIFGGSSRIIDQKSFRLVARKTGYYDEKKYNGNGSFNYPLFAGRTTSDGASLEKYDRIVLRNGGNDSFQSVAADPLKMTLTRDSVANSFAAKYAPLVACQSSRFAIVYLNGEYYGILDMKEDINDDYISRVYSIEDKDSITVIKSELDTTKSCGKHDDAAECRFCGSWFFYEVDNGAESELDEFEALCKKVIACSDADMASMYEELSQKLDIDNFMQYTALNLFCCNTDWAHNNIKLWRYTGAGTENQYTDGKWRFALRDMDFSFGRYKSNVLPEIYTMADADTFEFTLGNYLSGEYKYEKNYRDSLYIQGLLDFCLRNEGFCEKFDKYARSLASKEATEALKAIMLDAQGQIDADIQNHLDRWAGTVNEKMKKARWTAGCKNMIQWADERGEYFISHLDKCLENYR